MTINKLTASFGKLQNETLRFHDGLNIIYAPNESGKSTWCAFIRAMLYGVDSAERSRAGYMPDKLKYIPWSGAPMEGTMELTADRCDITLTRRTLSKSAPMREFSATYTGTSVPVENMNGTNAGELLTGVTKDVFRRSAFIAQGNMGAISSPELEKRISSLVSSGEEQTSYSEADERLRSWQRKRRWNRRGQLPDLEARMDETRAQLDDMSGSVERLEELEGELAAEQKKCGELEKAVIEARKRQRKEALSRLDRGRSGLRQLSDEHDRAIEQLSLRRKELRESPFGDRSPEELEQEVRADVSALAELGQPQTKPLAMLPALLFFVLAAAAAAVYSAKPYLALLIAAAVFCVAAVVLMLRSSRVRHAASAAAEQRGRILKKYGAGSADQVLAALERSRQLWEALEDAEDLEEETRRRFEEASQMQSQLEDNTVAELDFVRGSTDAAKLGRALTASRSRVEQLSGQIATLRGRLSASGDPVVLGSALSVMQEEHQQLQSEYDAIGLALELLRDADREIQTRFSPQLGRLAAEYMSAVTGGRYEDVLIGRDLSARVRAKGDAVARDPEYLSAGTLDLMYLAVRLAICELALPEGEPCPLILDDALVNLDEKRFQQAIELLKQIARERQVILFTCRQQPESVSAES